MPSTFLRPRGDRAIARPFVREAGKNMFTAPSVRQWADLRHGDIIYNNDPIYCGPDTWVVVRVNGGLTIEITGDNFWYTEISATITRDIEDPLDFYNAILREKLYQSITIINFDVCAHNDILLAITGGRKIDLTHSVWWAGHHQCFKIDIPQSSDGPPNLPVRLDEGTPDLYLSNRNPDREHNRKSHEVFASKYFRELRLGAPIPLGDFAEEGWNGVYGHFTWAHPTTGPVEAVGIMIDGSTIVFTQRMVPFETGSFSGVRVWAGTNPRGYFKEWMIHFS